jgi:hypothetical protein
VTRRLIALSALAVTAALIVVAGPASTGRGDTAVRRPELSVVRITARIGDDEVRSAGVVIDGPQGRVLTTAHSLWGATSLKVSTGLAVVHGRIMARDPCDDLAVVEMQPRLPGFRQIARGTDSNGIVVLRPQGPPHGPLRSVRGARVREEQRQSGVLIAPDLPPSDDARPLTGTLTAEDTGAPVIDANGRLSGLVRAGDQGAAELPWDLINDRLQELRPGAGTVFAGWKPHYRCATALQARALAQHPGYDPDDARLNAPVPATRLPGTQGVDQP